MDSDLTELAAGLGERLKARRMMLATAESCTGGWVSKVITDVTGSSAWFDRGFVVYHGRAKHELLGVRQETLQAHGEVSEATVREMAEGALARSQSQVTLAISGIAGPGGGTPYKPVGMVCFAWAGEGRATRSCVEHFDGDREAVRHQAVARALRGVLDMLGD
jgi:nicotinamide-nucleotide amidase